MLLHTIFFAHEFHEFTRTSAKIKNGDLLGRTNHTNNMSGLMNSRASERRTELVWVMPSAAENIEFVKIRATEQVAIIT